MKTPKEWLGTLRYHSHGLYPLTESDIKAIQDEAFKDGFLEACKCVSVKALLWDEGDGYSPTKLKAAHEIYNSMLAKIAKTP